MKTNVKTIVGLGLLTAIVVILQFLGGFIHLGPFQVSLVLVPIVIGASLYGVKGGAWLGFVFGMVVLLNGDAAAFLGVNVFGTILTVLVKGTAAGFVSGIVYRLLAKKNETVAVFTAAVVCPVVNTGIFLVGCVLFFIPTLQEWGASLGFTNVFSYMMLGLVGGNFLFELLFNIVLSPVIVRLIRLAKK